MEVAIPYGFYTNEYEKKKKKSWSVLLRAKKKSQVPQIGWKKKAI